VTPDLYPWQQSQWARLGDAIEKDRLPHALLLAGQSGLGMEEFALSIAAKLLCSDAGSGQACGKCKSCLLFLAGNHPDISRIAPEEPGKQIKVDAIREVIRFIQLSSQYGRGKIAVIVPAEAMNRSAANSLLKTLEEPPAGSVFILIAHQPSFLPVTIRSRCQRFNFAQTYHESTIQWLAARTGSDAEQAGDLLVLSQGRPLQAESLIENDTIASRNQVLADLDQINQVATDVVKIAQRWHDYGATEVLLWIMSYLGAMARLKLHKHGQVAGLSALNRDLQRIANGLDLYQLVCCYDLAFQNYRSITGPYNLNQTGLLEEFIVYWQSTRARDGRR